jgi:ribonuclease P/MRP protein subunit RPP1
MSFYECCAKSLPEGSDSSSRLALSARRLGYEGVVICNSSESPAFRREAAALVRDIDVAWGVQIAANNPKVLRSRVASFRNRVPFIAVSTSSEDLARAACEDPNVDVLIHSESARRGLGIAAARAARQNQVAIGFDLSPMIRLRGSSRIRWLRSVRRNLELARKFDLSMIITTSASSHLDLRSPRDLMALAEVAGLEPEEAEGALRLPGTLLELNRRNWLSPGVELL